MPYVLEARELAFATYCIRPFALLYYKVQLENPVSLYIIDRLGIYSEYMLQRSFGAAGTGFLAYISAFQNRFTSGSAHTIG